MNKNVSGNIRGLYSVILMVAFNLLGTDVLAVETASPAVNRQLMDQAISHSEEALKSANAGQVDQTLEHIQMALDSTDEIEVANAAAMQRAAARLKTARRNLKKGEPIEGAVGDLQEAVKSLKELKANSL